jgi:hypothetical protein
MSTRVATPFFRTRNTLTDLTPHVVSKAIISALFIAEKLCYFAPFSPSLALWTLALSKAGKTACQDGYAALLGNNAF